ncbi:histidine kinase [Planococcus glaciei]|uniref:histidine kinase n=1 Tax=Planococcus glaciei TaxID=459472 RepID=A0A7H8QEK8_9BACL|nr:ATP-binding protein [Planococcus glaciei]ETP69674.1 sensor histidine kinase [Planococcus glaciei CHR43]ETP70730.1 sensor histidine kinase [Planococcus glaciei CHR43]ETP70736.1 sensor histidine kinase [Planococcus glaciei CHR43]KOF11230.1 histidine kinase [Planococcus glaciei]MBX0313874.1 HAMP domain-containing protein [Planococcus glaciei]
MNRIWNSVVGKLWITILLLVSFVLFIVTVLLLEFLGNYHSEAVEETLTKEADTIASIFNDHGEVNISLTVIDDILGPETNAVIAEAPHESTYYIHNGINGNQLREEILNEPDFQKVFETDETVMKEMLLPSLTEEDMLESYIVLASPLQTVEQKHGTVFIYQSLEVMDRTAERTTNIVFLSAFIAFILTTFFAFFLSTRITSPLRKMREGAFELAKGNFDTKVRATSSDEIGQLATAFNQMGRQLKHHVEVINQEKEQLSSILTSMADAVITFNQDGTILLSNPPAEKLLQQWLMKRGVEKGEPLPSEMIHMLEHVLDYEDEIQEELEMEGAYYAITFSPLYSGESVRGAVAVLHNMTEQHRLEKLREDFIANVSHELRTPIAMLQGYSEALLDDVGTTEDERREMTKIIYEESQRMGRLVTDLLNLARMESGYMRLYKELVQFNEVIERMSLKFSQAAKETGVQLSFATDLDDWAAAEIDEDRIEQVMTNLIDNALRHTPAGGQVIVKVEQEQGYAKVSVNDTGIGIPEEDLQYVFERFYKADKARTLGKSGTGLGLAIASNIINAHDGKIYAESKVGEGTSFVFLLPLKKM